jgi:hypothetical protein
MAGGVILDPYIESGFSSGITSTAYLSWNDDFQINDKGEIYTCDPDTAYKQRLIRRLLTASRVFNQVTGIPIIAPDYIFNPSFGAGLRRKVDTTLSVDDIKRIVLEQIILDPETSGKVKPIVQVVQMEDRIEAVRVNIIAVRETNNTVGFSLGF